MIRILFHHRSHAIDVVEFLGVLALAAMPWRMVFNDSSTAAWVMLGVVVIAYGFIRYCATVRWYADAARYEGIELQFKKGPLPHRLYHTHRRHRLSADPLRDRHRDHRAAPHRHRPR